jgi:DNA-binding NarL/FixJ family response regulator
MSQFAIENVVPTIMLVEQQAFVSESVANSFRVEFKRHAILECGENFADIENTKINLKLVVITKSMLLNVFEKSKKFSFLRDCFGSVPIALLGDTTDQDSLEFLERFNLRGVFPDQTPTNTLIAGLKFILEGGEYFPSKFNELKEVVRSGFVPDELHTDFSEPTLSIANLSIDFADPFTRRERAVLDCLAKGQPNKVIAGQLEIAENTIKIHIRNILKKLNVSNRTEAVLAAHKMSLVELQ